MQNCLLLAIAVLVVALIAFGHLGNYFRKKRFLSLREAMPIEEIMERDFPGCDRARFVQAWKELSATFAIDPEKLRSGDTIADFVRARDMPELILEKLEEFLRYAGLEPGQFNKDASAKDLVLSLIGRPGRDRHP